MNRIKYILTVEVDDEEVFSSYYYDIDQLEEEGLRKAQYAAEDQLKENEILELGNEDD